MAKCQKRMRFLENNGGPILGILALITFGVHLILAHLQPNSGWVKLLQVHGSAAQVLSVVVVLLVACITWGIQKVLFKIKEREALKTLVEEQAAQIAEQAALIDELKASAAKVQNLEQQIAELAAQLENQKTQRPPE